MIRLVYALAFLGALIIRWVIMDFIQGTEEEY